MAGDLYVRIKIKKHSIFTRKGADLFIEKKITLLEGLTGFNFSITHLDGTQL
jgi:DnaJ family protein A protein 2